MTRSTGVNAVLGADGWVCPDLYNSKLTRHAAEHAAMGVPAVSARRTVTLIGDSIFSHGGNATFGETAGQGHTSQSIIGWASSQMPGASLAVVANRAVGGTLIDGAAASSLIGSSSPQMASALTDNSDILHIHSGINHLNPAVDVSAPTVAQIVTKIRLLLDLASAQKSLVVVDSLDPINASATTPTGASARRADIPLINAELRAMCLEYSNVAYNDTYSVLALDVAGNADPNYVFSTDGIHRTTWGAYVAGAKTAETYKAIRGLGAAYRVTKNVVLPDFTGTAGTKNAGSGTINGTVADGMSLILAAGTAVVNTSTVGNRQLISIDNSAGAITATLQLKFANPASYLGTLANGDISIAFGRVDVFSQTLMRRCNMVHQLNPSGSVVNNVFLGRSTQENSNPPLPIWPPEFGMTCVTDPFTFGATPASMTLAFTVEVSAGGSAALSIGSTGYNAVTAF